MFTVGKQFIEVLLKSWGYRPAAAGWRQSRRCHYKSPPNEFGGSWRQAGLVCLAGLIVGTCWTAKAFADCDVSGLDTDLTLDKGSIDITVYYDEGDCADAGVWPDAYATDLANAAGDSLDGYRDFAFLDPYQTGLPEYKIKVDPDSSCNAYAPQECLIFASDRTVEGCGDTCDNDEMFFRKGAQHEMFHHIQYNYGCGVDASCGMTGTGQWAFEGTARYMEDHLFADLDESFFTSPSGFHDQVNSALASPSTRLFDLSYSSCLFWSYCGEQFGTEGGEPELGLDFVRTFWEDIAAGTEISVSSANESLENTIDAYGANSLDEVWLSYAIANYANDFDLSLIPNGAKYDYVDENQWGDGNWNEVATIAAAMPSNDTDSLDDYSIRYYEANVNQTFCTGVGFRGKADAQNLGWAVLGINAANQVVALSRGEGNEFGRTIIASPTQPITKIAAIVAGLGEGDDYEYWFDSGLLGLDIFRPTTDHPARVNVNDDYRPFLVKVIVDGPDDLKPEGAGPLSVLGLQPEDFTVEVDGIDSDVISASYVGQYYWLVVAAPPALPIGTYDLQVILCDDVLMDTELDSVIVDDLLTNHVLVIDVSGSMDSPTTAPKLDSAKIAASLYTDAVSESDRVGLVTFSGNNVDCDDDAVVKETLATATDAQKADVQTDIDSLVTDWKTAIGDGLWKGQDQLDLFVDPAETDVIVLLSDGLENEARRWNTFDGCDSAWSRIEDEDTIIHSIAFGPDSDQEMMQEIADFTAGDYEYVDVTAAGMRGGAPLSRTNELAVAYMDNLRQASDLEQLFFAADDLPLSATVEIPITEEGIEEALFYFNVSTIGSNLNVDLFDPDGNAIPAAAADVFETDTHTVFHFSVKPAVGTWEAELTSDVETDFIAGVLGRNPHLPKLELQLGKVPTGGYQHEAMCEFEQGVPVTILAVLHSSKGPLLGAHVEAEIERPDGGLSCSPYPMLDDGTQNDGQPDDGIYGLIYTETSLGSLGASSDDDDDPETPGSLYRGSYQVHVTATGVSPTGEDFTRIENTSFQVCKFFMDLDGDTLPDSWEVFYGTNPFVKDETKDFDLDKMINRDEFHRGCDPYDPDTDGDGELDGSEVIHGRCPVVPDDLAIKAPMDVAVVTDTGDLGVPLPSTGLLLRFPWLSTYQSMRIERAVGAPAFFALLTIVEADEDNPIPVTHLDTAVATGVIYYYRFQAIGVDGGESRISPIVSATYFPDCNGNGVADPDEVLKTPVDEDFMVLPPDWTFLGKAAYNALEDDVRLVPTGKTFAAGVAALNSSGQETEAFEVEFDFEMTMPAGGVPDGSGDPDPDGLCMIVTKAPITAPGYNGYGLGYKDLPEASFAVEFDAFQNFVSGQPDDPDGNHVGLDVGGSVESIATAFVATDFDETGVWHARVRFLYGEITVWVTPPGDSEMEALSALVPELNVPAKKYFAFGSGTGANSADTDIDNVVITLLDQDCNGNGIFDECDIAEGTSSDDNGNGIPDECDPGAPGCDGDSNGDGAVDPLDAGFIMARLGCSVGTGDAACDAADVNGDGMVDPLDVGYVLARLGTCS